MIRAAIVGGTGYTGVELLRILVLHPEVAVAVVTSRSDAGTRLRMEGHTRTERPDLPTHQG